MTKSTFLATIKDRFCLNSGSDKETWHLVLDIEGSGIEYKVGDCLGIYPTNDPALVSRILETFKASGSETIIDRKGNSHQLDFFLSSQANLLRLPSDVEMTLEAFCKKLGPQLPRFYSVASSQQVVGNEVHLTVGLIEGTCTQYICKRAPLGEPVLSVFHQPSHQFSLPPESFTAPIIMIGPGTGIAPFRGFMQERIAQNASAKNWLFFGERRQQTDFYYQTFWQKLVSEEKLQLDCAFSRDQPEKVYVQHKMLEKGAELFRWIQEGAYLFVCGNADKMAKDVDKTLHAIIETEGKCSPEEAKAFIKSLKKINRYQRDVY